MNIFDVPIIGTLFLFAIMIGLTGFLWDMGLIIPAIGLGGFTVFLVIGKITDIFGN